MDIVMPLSKVAVLERLREADDTDDAWLCPILLRSFVLIGFDDPKVLVFVSLQGVLTSLDLLAAREKHASPWLLNVYGPEIQTHRARYVR